MLWLWKTFNKRLDINISVIVDFNLYIILLKNKDKKMKNTTTTNSFIKKCVLMLVIAVTAAIGLISMPIFASATTNYGTSIVEVQINEATDMSIAITDPMDGYVAGKIITLTLDGHNVSTVYVFIDNTSGTPVAVQTINEPGVFNDVTVTFTMPPEFRNGQHEIIVVAHNYTGESSAASDDVLVRYIGGTPIIDSVEPPTGPVEGGTEITIRGDNFTPDSEVTIDGKPCLNVVVVNQNTITCKTPPHIEGIVNIVVTTPSGGSSTTTGENRFKYVDMNVLVPDTGLFRIGNKMVSLYEVIGMVALLIAIAAFIFCLVVCKKKKSEEKKNKRAKTGIRKVAKRTVKKSASPKKKVRK